MPRAAVRLISTQGYTGTGPREVVAAWDAPHGSVWHYFPGGKDQLVSEALTITADRSREDRYLPIVQIYAIS
jgi:AcrR family transcriptional regulator